jgi:hypothetical protein
MGTIRDLGTISIIVDGEGGGSGAPLFWMTRAAWRLAGPAENPNLSGAEEGRLEALGSGWHIGACPNNANLNPVIMSI